MERNRTVKRPIRIQGDVAYIPLTKGYEAIIDAADVSIVDGWNWSALPVPRADGAIRTVYVQNRRGTRLTQHTVYLHRVLMDAPAGWCVDHIDGDGLNNRRSNLRIATPAQNSHNARVRSDNRSGAKGVFWDLRIKRWVAVIKLQGKRHRLGSFAQAEDAKASYAKASLEMHGEFGRIN